MCKNSLPDARLKLEISSKVDEAMKILKVLGYRSETITPEEFYDYMTGETPTGDLITLTDILNNEFLMVHEVVEISELKKRDIPINKQTIIQFYTEVFKVHFTALNYELTYALNKQHYEWIRSRLTDTERQLNDPYMQKFNNLKQEVKPILMSIIKKFEKSYEKFDY